jgi:nitrogen fixation protein NifB
MNTEPTSNALPFENHPCFNPAMKGRFGRVHLPVAPKCNIQCRYCNRRYDCVNESRPGVTSQVLSPGQALHYVARLLDMNKPISVVGIAGPGDAFANPDASMETMRLIRRKFPKILLCLSTNGLQVAPYIDQLAELQVSHVTITMNALDEAIGSQLYAWVRDGRHVLRGEAAARLMIDRQTEAIRACKAAGLTVKVNSILVPGVNDGHLPELAAACAGMGVDLHNVIPLCPVEGTDFEHLEEPSAIQVKAMRQECGQHVKQMTHCQRCRADACGLLCEGTTQETMNMLQQAARQPINPDEDRPYTAVASREGMLVNMHLGEATEFMVFGRDGDSFSVVDVRKSPERGCGDARWYQLSDQLSDCRAVLVSSAGPKPTRILTQSGIKMVIMEGLIEEALTELYSGRAIKAPVRKFQCGVGCTGDGGGCG